MKTVLANTSMKSALAQQSALKPKAGLGKRALVSTLILTSLVDVFSILVIYLLVNTSASQEVTLQGEIELPTAVNTSVIEAGLVLRLQQDGIFLNDQLIPANELLKTLEEYAAQDTSELRTLIIQADRRSQFAEMSPVLLSAARTGFHRVRFAVIKAGS